MSDVSVPKPPVSQPPVSQPPVSEASGAQSSTAQTSTAQTAEPQTSPPQIAVAPAAPSVDPDPAPFVDPAPAARQTHGDIPAVLMEGLVNMRMHIDEADRARAMRAATSASGILIGAWVGGRYELTAERLYFTPKAYGMKHPKPITIPLASIRQIGEGRMLILFPTIDLITAQGTFRLRLPPGKTAMFRERLRVLSAHLR